MLYKESNLILFNSYIENAIESLKNKEFDKAKEYIHSAMIENDNSPKPHNLLGIYYEMNGCFDLARKHYRASISLDQTLKSANNNLERVCVFKYICSEEYMDYGQDINQSKVNE